MKRALLPGLAALVLAGCGTWAGRDSGVGGGATGLGVVREFGQRFGTRGYRQFVALFAEGAVVEVRGLGVVIQGRQGLRGLAEYAAEVKASLRVVDLRQSADTVFAGLAETNDWLGLAGVPEVSYRARFIVRTGRIGEAVIELEAASRELLKQKMAGLLLPLLAEEPDMVSRLLPGGKLMLDRETGTALVRLLRERQSRPR